MQLATRYIRNPVGDASMAASLYIASGTRYECRNPDSGEYHMVHADRRDNLAIITSEPLTDDSTDWLADTTKWGREGKRERERGKIDSCLTPPLSRVPVPVNFLVAITSDMHVLLSPIHRAQHSGALSIETPGIAASLAALHGWRQTHTTVS